MADSPDISDTRLRTLLAEVWGYDSFRPMQLETIRCVLSGQDTLALMPTGAGKSIVYQLPALAREGLCVVITPLVALMKDQVDRLRSKHIPAVAIHGGMSARQIDAALENCVWGNIKFLYLSPERLGTQIFRMRAPRMPIRLIAVDEAHCISQWGYDFRPAYLQIAALRELAPEATFLALTASATPTVADDIMQRLGFARPNVLRSSFARPNLSLTVRRTTDREGQLLRVIDNVPGSGIVYVRTRERAERLAAWLAEAGYSAQYYHAGLGHGERALRQDEWLRGQTRIMVATNAFGLGIDKPDVRFVIHYEPDDSLEAYYQEAGRAGRDGRRAYAVLLTGPAMHASARRRLTQEFPSPDTIRRCYSQLMNYLQVPIGEGKYFSFPFNLYEFASRAGLNPGTAAGALRILQQNGYLTLIDETEHPARILFCVSRDDLYRIRIEREELDTIIRTLLRLYTGVFTEFRAIDVQEIAHVTTYTEERVRELLKQLWQLHIIRYIPKIVSPMISLDEERLPEADVTISPESYRLRKEAAERRLDAMLAYADNTETCRAVLIREYFGEAHPEPCGVCDLCLARRKTTPAPEETARHILAELDHGPLSLHDLVARFSCPPQRIIEAVERLVADEKISSGPEGILHRNA